MSLFEHGDRNAHVLGQVSSAGIVLHHTTASVVLGVPDDLIRGSLVQAKAERRLVLPHLTSHIVTAAKLVGKTLAITVQDETTNTSEGLSGKELNLGIWVIWLHKASWVNLNPLKVK